MKLCEPCHLRSRPISPLRGRHGVVLPGLPVWHTPMRPAFVRAARLFSLSRLRIGHPYLRAWPMSIGRWLSPLPTCCRHRWLCMRVRRVQCTSRRLRTGRCFPRFVRGSNWRSSRMRHLVVKLGGGRSPGLSSWPLPPGCGGTGAFAHACWVRASFYAGHALRLPRTLCERTGYIASC